MASRSGPRDQSLRKARERVDRAIAEVRQARISSGMSQRALAELVVVSRPRISRIERGKEPDVPAYLLARMAASVGLDLALRTYPGGGPLLDVAQERLLGRLRDRLGPDWEWQFEVALPIVGDLRAWDAIGTCRTTGLVIHVEAETRVDDAQALLRRHNLKRRDGGAARTLLLIADTRHNRDVVRAADEEFRAAFPADTRRTLAALVAGRDPGADALVMC